MATYRTPGVYVEEISTLPPSVAPVSTAIPAFIGYTEVGPAPDAGGKVVPVVARINTMLEYRALFGGANPSSFDVAAGPADAAGLRTVTAVTRQVSANEHSLYYSLSLYFQNGGSSCYVVSVGNYTAAPTRTHFEAGLEALAKEDEPTLILFADAVGLSGDDYHALCQAALAQCKRLGDRFAILDIMPVDDDDAVGSKAVAAFRDGIGANNLAYGAAYHPFLQTSLSYDYAESTVTIALAPAASKGDGEEKKTATTTLDKLRADNTALYNQVKAALAQQRVVLPPSAAVAGVYASVDRDRGVWKAPANVSLASVIAPVAKITHQGQEDLNVDATGGKSINAIRAFTGKGTLVWGARTLAGNDNEWRYVPVRRLFITIEESVQKASAFAVFEPNDAGTWLKVKAMIESYLYGLWEQGALAGPTPEAAYFVHVGLGKTMTAQDVLEGRMIVEVGIAAVRPAEFIILRFTHKLQEA
jgi:phage tail sheath protein FI